MQAATPVKATTRILGFSGSAWYDKVLLSAWKIVLVKCDLPVPAPPVRNRYIGSTCFGFLHDKCFILFLAQVMAISNVCLCLLFKERIRSFISSSFKPFVYLTALEKGYPQNLKILDAPFVIDQGADLGKWNPANYTKKFYGLSTMRLGLEKSRNLMTVRLAQMIGIDSRRWNYRIHRFRTAKMDRVTASDHL